MGTSGPIDANELDKLRKRCKMLMLREAEL
jgi:hypothetical protein